MTDSHVKLNLTGGSMTVTIKKIGGSMAVVIPKSVAREMDLAEGSSLEILTSAGSIVMRKQGRRARRPLKQLLPQIKSSAYRRHNKAFAADRAVGKEIW